MTLRPNKNSQTLRTEMTDNTDERKNGNESHSQKTQQKEQTTMERLFGFGLSDISSVKSFVTVLNKPMDPSSLAVTRILFGGYANYGIFRIPIYFS